MNYVKEEIYKDRKIIILGTIFTIIQSIFIILCPLAIMYLIDSVPQTGSKISLNKAIIVFIIVYMMDPFIGLIKNIFFISQGEKKAACYKKDIFSNTIKCPLIEFEKMKNGDILSVLTNDTKEAGRFIIQYIPNIVKDLSIIIGIIICMMTISIPLTVVVLGVFFIVYFVNEVVTSKVKKLSRNVQEKNDTLYTTIEQAFHNIISIKSYTRENEIIGKTDTIINEVRENYTRVNVLISVINSIPIVAVGVCQALIYYTGIRLLFVDEFSLGKIAAFIQYFRLITAPFYDLINSKIQINVVKPMLQRIKSYNNLEKEDEKTNTQESILPISLKNLGFSYENRNIINQVSFELPTKGIVLINGESGEGKSTFCKLLLSLYKPTIGGIVYGGVDSSEESIRGKIAFVPQQPEIMNDTFFNNISMNREDVSIDEVEDVCRRVNILDRIISSENGFDTIIQEKVDLSGGEKQRISIARAIVSDTDVIVLDEPLASLDEENIEIVCNVLEQIAENKLIILISHIKGDRIKHSHELFFNHGNISLRLAV